MKIKPNFCSICGDQIIDKGKPLSNYTCKLVELTGGHTTHIAICKKCKPNMTTKDWEKLVELNMNYLANDTDQPRLKEVYKKMKFRKFKSEAVKEI